MNQTLIFTRFALKITKAYQRMFIIHWHKKKLTQQFLTSANKMSKYEPINQQRLKNLTNQVIY